MIARGLGLDHHGLAGRVQPRQKHRGFHLRRRHRRRVADRQGVGRPGDRHRQAPALAPDGAGPEQRQGVGHPRHGARAQRSIAGKGRTDGRGGHGAHDQPHARAGIAAIDHILGFGETAHPHPMHMPDAIVVAADLGPEGAHRAGRIQHILPLQKAGDHRLAHRHRPKDERAVRDRLVARHIGHALERHTLAGSHRNGIAMAGHRGHLLACVLRVIDKPRGAVNSPSR